MPFNSRTGEYDRPSAKPFVIGGIISLLALVLLIGGCSYNSARDAAKPGYIGVCQTGGTFEGDNGTCGVLQPGEGKQFLGFSNNLREYPITQRNFTMSDAPDAEARPITLTTKDGKRVRVSIQFLFTLDRNQIEAFYKNYGLKTYGGKHVYEEEGWVNFLKAEFGQVAGQSLKTLVLSKTGAQLNPAFAAAEAGDKPVDFDKLNAEGNLAELENEAGDRFDTGLVDTLGGKFFTNIRVSNLQVEAPEKVQSSVDAAVVAKATEVTAIADGKARKAKADADKTISNTEADAKLYASTQEAKALKLKAQAYGRSPEKAQVDAIAALPDGLQTLIIGGKSSQLLSIGK